jgi:hypothetical protein
MKSMGYIIAIIITVFACIAGAVLTIFGFLYVLGSGGAQGGGGSWVTTGVGLLVFGIILLILAAGVAFYIFRRSKKAVDGETNVTYKVDLPANVSLDQMKCKSCGGALTMDNIQMVAGAPVVNCPYCHTTYQLTEEPKW